MATGGLPDFIPWGSTGTAFGGTPDVAAGVGDFRENSDVSLKYQIKAPPPTTTVKTRRTKSSPRQDFMGGF